ncbi:MAG: fibronectin type III domain-containing protein [Microgenomates group bacterium]
MIYSNLYTKEKKIPTILALFIFVFVFGVFFKLTSFKNSSFPVKASPNFIKRVEIANITPIQAVVFWQTENKEVGWVIYGDNSQKLNQIAFDDRDIADKKMPYFNHLVTLKNLKPDTVYYFVIISDNKKIVDQNGNLFSFKTPQILTANNKFSPTTGKLVEKNLTGIKGAIVLLSVDKNVYPVISQTKDFGEWLLPLNSFYEKNSLKERVFKGDEKIKIEFLTENGKESTVVASLKKISSTSLTVVLGQNYQLEDSDVLGEQISNNVLNSKKIEIIYPQENALIPGAKPLIKGTALPNTKVSIEIFSKKNYAALVYADKNGYWNYLLPENLQIGDYLLKIKTMDENKKEVVLSRRFKIVDNGGFEGRVLGTATGEPTLTLATTNIPTIAPTNVLSNLITSTPPPPRSGVSDVLPIVGGISLIILGGAILLVF